MAEFKNRLYDLRKQRGLTQLELSNLIGVGKQTISQYERGVRRPDFDTLTLLCDCFNVSADYLLGVSDVTMRFVDSNGLARLDSPSLTSDESALLSSYRSLNSGGRQEARSHMDYLCSQERYRKDIGLLEDVGSA